MKTYNFKWHLSSTGHPQVSILAQSYSDAWSQLSEKGLTRRCRSCGDTLYHVTGPDYEDGTPVIEQGYLYVFLKGKRGEFVDFRFIPGDLSDPEGARQDAVAIKVHDLLGELKCWHAFVLAEVNGEITLRDTDHIMEMLDV